MIETSCEEWIADLASAAPTPGGGGACALVGAVGMALGSMVGNLTLGKKKYADVETEMRQLLEESQRLIRKLEDLVEGDARAFAPLAAAYKMPANTDEEKAGKECAVQAALAEAAACPLAIAECCCEALALMEQYARKGSALARSDAGVGAACLRAAVEGAKLNVLINVRLMKDQKQKEEFSRRMEAAAASGSELADRIFRFVEEELRKE